MAIMSVALMRPSSWLIAFHAAGKRCAASSRYSSTAS
jgi:hypothetical protein